MNKIFLIIQREYLVRVRKPIFIIMTLLGPLLATLPTGLSIYFATRETDARNIMLFDESGLFKDKLKSKSLNFKDLALSDTATAKKSFDKSDEYYALLYIPKIDLENPKGITLYSKNNVSLGVEGDIKDLLTQELEKQKLQKAGIDKATLDKAKVKLSINSQIFKDGKEVSGNSGATFAAGFGAAFFLYLLLIIYGVQVMRGVMEEKTSRIMEVIISSVKPFQLMMGKIIGIGLVGLTQFVAWILLATLLTTAITSVYQDKLVEKAKTEQAKIQTPDTPSINTPIAKPASPFDFMASLNVPLLIGGFLFYFLGGYFLYSSLFAAIGSAADAETDTQQFMFPVTIPLIVSFIAAQFVVREPDGAMAFWLSMIPLTSPIIMMVRLPFNPEWWELALSMVLLVAGFIGTTWMAARIYRVGILMYGKKVSYKELAKWISYRA